MLRKTSISLILLVILFTIAADSASASVPPTSPTFFAAARPTS
jgi:hypothetical protein